MHVMSDDNKCAKQKRHVKLFKKYTSYLSSILGKKEEVGDMNAGYKSSVLVYGGNGHLGSKCIYQLKVQETSWVVSIDYTINTHADVNIMIGPEDDVKVQQNDIFTSIASAMGDFKFDVILCVADATSAGNAETDLIDTMNQMYKTNILSSLVCTSIAANYLRRGGLLVFSGAKTGIEPTPEMITYGISKAAVHHLVKSLAKKDSGMPPDSVVIGILPSIMECTLSLTANSRLSINATTLSSDIGYNSLQFIADLIIKWTRFKDVPPSGTLCQINSDLERVDIMLN